MKCTCYYLDDTENPKARIVTDPLCPTHGMSNTPDEKAECSCGTSHDSAWKQKMMWDNCPRHGSRGIIEPKKVRSADGSLPPQPIETDSVEAEFDPVERLELSKAILEAVQIDRADYKTDMERLRRVRALIAQREAAARREGERKGYVAGYAASDGLMKKFIEQAKEKNE